MSKRFATLLLGLLFVSTSGPFFMMSKVDAYAAVFYRTLFAGLLGLVLARARGALSRPALRAHARGLTLGGVLLGGHFLLWIKAFDLTDFASNMLLLVAQPVLATVLGAALGEPSPRFAWVAIGTAAAGMLLIAGADLSLGPQALLGDGLCIVAGGLIALFYVVARDARRALSMDAFMGVTMLIAALLALPVALLADVPLTGFSTESWGWLWAIVLITTFGGHSLMNLAAREVPLFTLNLVIVLEPAIAIGLGALLFDASVTSLQAAGGVLLACAVAIGLYDKPSDKTAAAAVAAS
jgi:drug/metabolite transporter (DMT)-like permease